VTRNLGRALGPAKWLLVGGLTLSSCVYFTGQTERYQPPLPAVTGPGAGKELYLRDCAWCHGDRGGGTSRAPDLVSGTNGPAFTDFMLATGRMPIDFPAQPVLRSSPAYRPSEVQAIIAHLQTLEPTGPLIPAPDPELGDLGVGSELYQENCAACHSTTAVGGALTPGRAGEEVRSPSFVAPDLKLATPTQIAEAMLVGPGAMPVFGEDTFSREEVDSVVAYVTYLQNPVDRGGAPIGRIGPVAEGAVGWIVGLGALLLVVRWIGTRTGQ
jgi:ubiquinol-cytochrome c reductase cytochrome c subunit